MMRRRKNIFASLDLGIEKIRLLIVQKNFQGLKLLVSQTFDRHDLSLLGQCLQKYRPQEIILLLPNERVIVRDVELPLANRKRIRSMLYFELAGQIPYGMSQVKMDYILLNKSRHGVQLKVFVVPRLFSQELEVLMKAGIEITRLLPRGLALLGYANANNLGKRLVKLNKNSGDLVVFSCVKNYFSKFYFSDEVLDVQELAEILRSEGAKADRWELLELNQNAADLWGAIHFWRQHPKFNLIPDLEKKTHSKRTLLAIITVFVVIVLVNSGTLYVKYLRKNHKLSLYQEELAVLMPRTEKVKQLTAETRVLSDKFDRLQQLSIQSQDYLIWLRELHLLLQEDTEVSILVFEDNLLRELHGKAPSATKISARLQNSPYFASPEFIAPIKPKEIDGQLVEEFSLTAALLNPRKGGERADE